MRAGEIQTSLPGGRVLVLAPLEDPDFFYFHLLLYGLGSFFRGCHGFEPGYLQAPVLLALDHGTRCDNVDSHGPGFSPGFVYVCLVG